MLLRRGHRLHSLGGETVDPPNLHKFENIRLQQGVERAESQLIGAILDTDIARVKSCVMNRGDLVINDWPFVQTCLKEAIEGGNVEVVRTLILGFAKDNDNPYQVGEFAIVVAAANQNVEMMISILEFWHLNKNFQVFTPLDVIAISVTASGTPNRVKAYDTNMLLETALYVATVDKKSEVLRHILHWQSSNQEKVGELRKVNADCILHAALEDDKEQVQILYNAGYRLEPDTTRRVNKDYLKKIKLFKARASPVYCAVAFEASQNVEKDDPMKKCLEYALQARRYANKIQDFNSEYNDVAVKSVCYALALLNKCTTKHEIQTLLQTKSYRGHHDANFNIAILDGHKELVAHEKFQQLLHKKWGQRDRVQYGDEIRFNIFWSEMGKVQKLYHFLKQILFFLILPVIFLVITFFPSLEQQGVVKSIVMQSQVPVNRFIYFEISKIIFNIIIFLTLVDGQDIAWYDILSVIWIVSYILEDFRTFHRLSKQGGVENRITLFQAEFPYIDVSCCRSKTFRRWLTFRNMYIIFTNITFLIALILRFSAYQSNQCRVGTLCLYEENKMAYIGACLWSVAALLTFLRSIQGGLMWRQTGPIIISMTYMIIDVFVFLFIFVIVYISFTLCVVYVYEVYDNDRTSFFNTHKSAFKLFYWTMIRTGNPHFPNIREYNSTLRFFNSSCMVDIVQKAGAVIEKSLVSTCAIGKDGIVGEFDSDIEEGIPYITGNVLWAVYQFIVFIVLLSVLRARMVNTYHRIFREADVQWKFFRASIWWKYLDHDSILPPPFTIIFLIHAAGKKLSRLLCSKNEEQIQIEDDAFREKRNFVKRYKRLLLTLIQFDENSWGFENKSALKSKYTPVDASGD